MTTAVQGSSDRRATPGAPGAEAATAEAATAEAATIEEATAEEATAEEATVEGPPSNHAVTDRNASQ